MKGGVDAATLDVLINGTTENTIPPEEKATPLSPLKPRPQTWSAQAVPFVPKPRDQILPTVSTHVKSEPYHDKKWQLPSPDSTSPEDLEELNYDGMSSAKLMSDNQQEGYGQDYEQEEEDFCDTKRNNRSVVLKSISPFTTTADVLAVIRGGAVLNIYLRPQQRTAHVAFVEPNAAEKFLIHSKRTDIYIRGKRVCTVRRHIGLLLMMV